MKIGLIVAIVLALGGSGAAGWFYMQSQELAAAAAAAPPAADGETGTAAKQIVTQESFYVSLQPPFVANYDNDGETGYYQVRVELLSYDKELEKAVDMHNPRIRDRLLMLFNSQTTASLRGRDAIAALRAKAKEEVDMALTEATGRSAVDAVLFSAFVIQ
jgi:flagellar FliL protein